MIALLTTIITMSSTREHLSSSLVRVLASMIMGMNLAVVPSIWQELTSIQHALLFELTMHVTFICNDFLLPFLLTW